MNIDSATCPTGKEGGDHNNIYLCGTVYVICLSGQSLQSDVLG